MSRAEGPTATRPPWTMRERIIAALFAVALAVQIGVPTVMLTRLMLDPEKKGYALDYRFGWQMFEGRLLDVRYVATMADDRSRRIDAVDEVGLFWGHVHYGSGTPSRLCKADPRRVTVTRYAVHRGQTRETEASFSCR